MGRLAFGNLEITPLADAAALVLGEWRLERERMLLGNFSLVFRKLDGRWVNCARSRVAGGGVKAGGREVVSRQWAVGGGLTVNLSD